MIYGVGINDSNYKIHTKVNEKSLFCPFYTKWRSMLERCYSEKYQRNQKTFVGCSVVKEWHSFMNFKAWMEKQDWEGNDLDKDILVAGNKIYGPTTCVFVSKGVNRFMREHFKSLNPENSVGVYFNLKKGKYIAECRIHNGPKKHLGAFHSKENARIAYLKFKRTQALILAEEQTNELVKNSLMNMYKENIYV